MFRMRALVFCWFWVFGCMVPAARGQVLWGYYPIHENDLTDHSGNNHNGAAADGAVTRLDLERGWVAVFNAEPAKCSRINCGTADPSAGGQLTVSVWLNGRGSNGHWQGIAGKSINYDDRRWIFQLRDPDGMIQWGGAAKSSLHIWSTVAPVPGTWQHVAATCDGQRLRIYNNGEIVGAGAGGFAPGAAAANVTLGSGEDRSDSQESFNGALDEIYIFTRALSQNQVKDLAGGVLPSFSGEGQDTDKDGLADMDEAYEGTMVLVQDSDGDGLSDGEEVHVYHTSPRIVDTDGDGLSDGAEIAAGTDPLHAEGATLEYNQMLDVLAEMNRELKQECTTTTMATAVQHAADFLRSQPAVATVSYGPPRADGEPRLSAEFRNGVHYLLVFVNDDEATDLPQARDPAPPSFSPNGSGGVSDVGIKAAAALGSQGIPEKGMALFQMDNESQFQREGDDQRTANMIIKLIEKMARSGNYTPQVFDRSGLGLDLLGRIEELKTLHNYGVVFLCAHGMDYNDASGRYMALYTDEPHTASDDAQFLKSGDFQAHRILIGNTVIYGRDQLPRVLPDLCYSVTDRFFDFYLGSFETHSLVFLTACHGGEPLGGQINPLVSVLLKKNAGAVLAWTARVRKGVAFQGSGYLFSRLLGYNEGCDGAPSGYPCPCEPQSPPIRTYDLADAYEALEHGGQDLDLARGSALQWFARGAGTMSMEDVILMPTLHHLSWNGDRKEITLLGEFGDNGKPTVKAGDQTLNVKSHERHKIVAQFDENDNGKVTVEVLDHVSNAIPVTEWRGKLVVEGDMDTQMGPHVKATFQTRFRADIHSTRQKWPEDKAERAATKGLILEQDSSCTCTFSGTFVYNNVRYAYSGAGSAPLGVAKTGIPYFGGTLWMKPKEGVIQFLLSAAVDADVTITDLRTGQSQRQKRTQSIPVTVQASLGKYGDVPAGQQSVPVGIRSLLKITWESFVVNGAPDDDTPAS